MTSDIGGTLASFAFDPWLWSGTVSSIGAQGIYNPWSKTRLLSGAGYVPPGGGGTFASKFAEKRAQIVAKRARIKEIRQAFIERGPSRYSSFSKLRSAREAVARGIEKKAMKKSAEAAVLHRNSLLKRAATAYRGGGWEGVAKVAARTGGKWNLAKAAIGRYGGALMKGWVAYDITKMALETGMFVAEYGYERGRAKATSVRFGYAPNDTNTAYTMRMSAINAMLGPSAHRSMIGNEAAIMHA